MDTTQLLLSTAVTITTVLLIIVSVQLISLLKHLKKDHDKESITSVKIPDNPPAGGKKDKITKKRINLTTLLDQMKRHISHPHSSKKKFFKS
ncbi:MAG: hypothetical protein UR42_C0024G0005 [Candidatus Roizmanbacteria bacterium GW2011_GWA2_33_33]|uniref:Uncharacterized protein n=2 Tax=Candidatus Roizmaniibacteriota TaxID=1752723 RepID=A0A0G0AW27_9BACT|nr:MAG: hypothetical protein UR42_C0024G0005 [Candidatus Roizmanbacteria bacterium GW2011_GWA2_33_33]KKP61438.1 MAG: hypothetical protein UR56_C0013G0018 [Candidatus Roizmanbacteria bacterium GW2011_GWC2_34_23]